MNRKVNSSLTYDVTYSSYITYEYIHLKEH